MKAICCNNKFKNWMISLKDFQIESDWVSLIKPFSVLVEFGEWIHLKQSYSFRIKGQDESENNR